MTPLAVGVRPGRGMAPWGSMYPEAVTGWLMAEMGLWVELAGGMADPEGKGVGDSGLSPKSPVKKVEIKKCI